jgi:hypothetical protein
MAVAGAQAGSDKISAGTIPALLSLRTFITASSVVPSSATQASGREAGLHLGV